MHVVKTPLRNAHGVIIGLVSVRADLNYQQGLNRMWSRSSKYDFYWPALAHIGEQVVLAQRMESVAPPGGVMLGESTARLVEHATVLGSPEWVHVKGAEQPLPVRRLLGAAAENAATA